MIKEKDKKIEDLERRVEDLEQYTRMDDLVISGLETTHRTYARITAGDKEDEDAPRDELHSLEQQVIKFSNSKDIPIDSKSIAAFYSCWHCQKGDNSNLCLLLNPEWVVVLYWCPLYWKLLLIHVHWYIHEKKPMSFWSKIDEQALLLNLMRLQGLFLLKCSMNVHSNARCFEMNTINFSKWKTFPICQTLTFINFTYIICSVCLWLHFSGHI